MSKNLKAQIFYAIDSSFKEGMSKHSYKKEYGDYGSKIFSYQTRDNLRDTAKDFSNYMKVNYPEIKQVKDIKKEHVTSYLEAKTEKCSGKTLQQYQTRLDKLGKCCGEVYHRKIDFKVAVPSKIVQNEKTRTVAMTHDDYEKAIKTGSKCDSFMALKVVKAFGLRVSEVIKISPGDINFRNGQLHIRQAKGGRDRLLEIRTSEQKEVLKELKEWRKVEQDKPILKVKADSVNNYLKTNLEKNGITKYSEHKTGVHSIRKMYATDRYNELRKLGDNHKEAWGVVSEELGHGKDREDLFHTYIVK